MQKLTFKTRLYPPAIMISQPTKPGNMPNQTTIELGNLEWETDLKTLADRLWADFEAIPETRQDEFVQELNQLRDKVLKGKNHQPVFIQHSTVKAHQQPLTNCAFNKAGDKYFTCSYDRTAKMWDTEYCTEECVFEGHANVVHSICLGGPYQNILATASFDKTAKIWDAYSGDCLGTLKGHDNEVICISFDPDSKVIATGSIDGSVKIWDVESRELTTVFAQLKEIVKVEFSKDGHQLLTAGYDTAAKLLDLRTGNVAILFDEHKKELAKSIFSFHNDYIATCSVDRTVKLWDPRKPKSLFTFLGHQDEVLDIAFNSTGTRLVSASLDRTCRLYNVQGDCKLEHVLEGHTAGVMNCAFNSQGTRILSSSSDSTAILWNPETGEKVQKLEDGDDEIFVSQFNQDSNLIIAALKSGNCIVWKDEKSDITFMPQ